ncbi:hypothetical protein [Aeromicrobium sp. CTD01-1L150]|uniref:hypothetical protein n=1 Tax=Aeromicrobium sp. CTD01-1L150 TaxID=3341830 RepID=UPI0035C243A1
MRRRPAAHRLVGATLSALLLGALLAACTNETDDVPDEAPTPAEASDTEAPATTALDAISDLPAVSLRSLDPPETPEGLDPVDVRTAADTIRAMALDAFSNRDRWDSGPTSEIQRSHLGIAGPNFPEQVETSEDLSDGAPTAQLFVSLFDSDAQPIALPRVVAARWNVTEAQGSDEPAPFVTLQVHAMFLLGDEEEPEAVLMRRTIGLGGNDLGHLDATKDWLVETHLIGADECFFYTEGLIRPDDDEPDVEDYEAFLAEAESEELDDPVERTPDLAELRQEACA